MSADKPFFLSHNEGFGQIKPSDELLHPEQNRLVSDDSATETQYFGFSIPEHGIHALAYCWHHPNLKVVTGGVFAWRGIKRYMPEAELCDVRAFMRDTALQNDLHEYRLDNGYGVRIVEPLKRLHMTYADAARSNSIDLEYEAVAPPVMFADGKHFEQSMRVRGEVTLRGQRYKVDCFNVRDRSWGKPRPEVNMAMPPYSWVTGVFNEGFSFNCGVFDQVENNPELKGRFELPMDQTLSAGWVQRDGVLARIVQATKRVVRDPRTLLPSSIELDIVDDRDRAMALRGTLVAACPWQVWPNVIFPVCLVRWECDGMEAHGDLQEAWWGDYMHQFAPKSA